MTFLGTRGWGLKSSKYRLAHLLDKLPGTCWTELVCWVEYDAPLSDAFNQGRCRQDEARCGACYCCKLGQLPEEPYL